jgi:hypothetical protein
MPEPNGISGLRKTAVRSAVFRALPQGGGSRFAYQPYDDPRRISEISVEIEVITQFLRNFYSVITASQEAIARLVAATAVMIATTPSETINRLFNCFTEIKTNLG